ncbi:MAG: helix-turn-helix domain-containing protein [Bacilli bacterium]|nr:helix-turn-helix domain-containing protein [Bacilli bacterium]
MSKLTDIQKKKIIADYIETQNYTEAGKMNNVADNTVRAIVNGNEEVSKKLERKKEENTQDILQYMDSISEKQKRIIDLSLDALEKKLENPDMFTNVKDIATVYGVIFDKALKYKEMKIRQQELKNTRRDIEDLTTLADMLGFNKKEEK